ncbi:MAG: PH domain-containing protein [Jatrophihabitantaceae bacterium]
MDDVPAGCRFGPDRRLTALSAAFALAAVAVVLVSTDVGARILFSGAALVLAGYAVTDLVFWPRLAADARGLTIRSPLERVRLSWADVEDVRADVRERLGLRSVTLEVDAGAILVVFSRRALGADPADVARAVLAADPRTPPA